MIHISKELGEILVGIGVTLFVYGVIRDVKQIMKR